jgi:peptidoglycan hydrolase-like protein with peptidoglycan-binding domain
MRVSGIPFVQGRNDYPDRDGRKYGIAIHNTSNDASDSGEASYARRRTDGVSSHLYVDGDSVTQSLDTVARAGHAGSSEGNDHAIAVEITGGNGKSRAWWLANVDWVELGRVLARVIRAHWPDGSFQVRRASIAQMRANPRVRAFYGHDDMRRAWGGTTHTDPGPNFPWDRLFEVVDAALGEYGRPPVKPKPTRPPATSREPGSRTLELRPGALMGGDDVAFVQRWVGIDDDGIFGPATRAAVIEYQRMRGITADGVVGPVTWRHMGVR